MRKRLSSIRRQPRAVQEAFCKGGAPLLNVQEILDRSEIVIDDMYASWAGSFAYLNDEFIAYVTKCAPHESKRQLLQRWREHSASSFTFYYRYLSTDLLAVYKLKRGWVIELNHCDGPDRGGRILAHGLGEMPVLCPTFTTAAQFAEASYPTAPLTLHWHSYW
jgi:hypothetical protein